MVDVVLIGLAILGAIAAVAVILSITVVLVAIAWILLAGASCAPVLGNHTGDVDS